MQTHLDQATMANPNETLLLRLLELQKQRGDLPGVVAFNPSDAHALGVWATFLVEELDPAFGNILGEDGEGLGVCLVLEGFAFCHALIQKYGPLETEP